MPNKKILVVNPPILSPKPFDRARFTALAPYLIVSHLRKTEDCQIYDFVLDKPTLDCTGDGIRIVDTYPCGNFENESISKHIYRLGTSEKEYIEFLTKYDPTEVWISSLCTFNWKSVQRVAEITKTFNKSIEIVLGGVYPTLCYDHAKENIQADRIVKVDPEDLIRFVDQDLLIYKIFPTNFHIATSVGCPNSCKWCAAHILEGHTMRFKDPIKVVDDIQQKYEWGVRRFTFLDSNILANYENHFKVILDEIIKRKIKANFSAGNGGFSALLVTQEILEKVAEAGFNSINIPLEFTNEDFLKKNDRPISIKKWVEVVSKLAPIAKLMVMSNFICGMPGQTTKEIYQTIAFITQHGASPKANFFTPVPGTPFEEKNLPLEYVHPFLFPYASNDMKVVDLEQVMMNYATNHQKVYIPELVRGHRSKPQIYTSGKPIPITVQ